MVMVYSISAPGMRFGLLPPEAKPLKGSLKTADVLVTFKSAVTIL